jgi:integral membrane protein
MTRNPRPLFRVVATAEAVSWLGLLAGMFVKWVLHGSQAGVHVFGPIHGTVFLLYLVAVLVAGRRFAWDTRTSLLAVVAAFPPFATLVFERWADHRGLLGVPAGASTRHTA